jgi:predicted metalloprotease
MWATVRLLLPLALAVNIATAMLERLAFWAMLERPLQGAISAAVGGCFCVVVGAAARGAGCDWGKAIWAAWWLGAIGAFLSLVEITVGLRVAPSSPTQSLPGGVAPSLSLADPNFAGIVLGIVLLAGAVLSVGGLIAVTPFTLLGYWAHGPRDIDTQPSPPRPQSPAGTGSHRFIRSLLILIVAACLLIWVRGFAGTLGPVLGGPSPGLSADRASRPVAPPAAPTAVAAPRAQVEQPYVASLPQSIGTYATLNAFVADARANVNDYWMHVPFPSTRPYAAPDVVLVRQGVAAGPGNCTPRPTSFYCPLNRTIYLYEPGLQSGNTWAGYAGMYAMVGHEWTHHVQFLLGVPEVTPQFELQADCGSGMFLRAGWPQLGETDLEAVHRMLSLPSDAEHGTPAQRLAAFEAGYKHGADDACGLPVGNTIRSA